MREIIFLRKNADKWKRYENQLNDSSANAEDLSDLYIELNNDLAYAKAKYPNTTTEEYLNQLSVQAHQRIYSKKKENYRRIITFWTEELPGVYAERQREMAYSLIIFVIAITIGVVSTIYNPSFTRYILGDSYVNMTLANIDQGDPLAVYKKAEEMDMFFAITFNNVRVSFIAFIIGLLTPVGVGMVLFSNGIMVGTFLQMFYEYELLDQAFKVIFIHGTLELSAIVIAGGAGITLGNSFLFPGTYTRLASFKKGAKSSLKMIVGLVPVFITAGLLEGFVTRYTQMPLILSLLIIGMSLFFILYYFIVLPNKTKANE